MSGEFEGSPDCSSNGQPFVHGSVQVEKHVSKSCIGDLLTWISGENTQFSCNHGFDVGSITPSATGVEVFRAT